jgi:hypothetical protein
MHGEEVPAVYALAAEVALARGLDDIGKLPGCAKLVLGDWLLLLNGHAESVPAVDVPGSVPPYHLLVTYKGAPVGLYTVTGGVLLQPDAETALLTALRSELEEAGVYQ